MDQQHRALEAVFQSVSPTMRDREPAPGRWSVAGTIEHVAIVENRVAHRLSTQIAEARGKGLGPELDRSPVIPTLPIAPLFNRTTKLTAPNAVQPTGVSAAVAWENLEDADQRIRDVLIESDNLALGTLTMAHPAFGHQSFYYWFAFIGAHKARHAAQIEEIKQELAIVDC
ncbi:MAG TPA: DinB family protein [Vicinamibacterales bacterium]|nr:DinB family protein [Vicinamibacterales bacterium]